ncbi:16293_t:CDS:2, partial [Acaulospora colombiana]
MSSNPRSKSYVVGIGMTKFLKPRDQVDYPAVKALLDANATYDQVQQVFVGYCYGDSTCGQRAVYQLGMTQIPIINVNNNCSTGSAALFLARQSVESGEVDCAMALGFEKMSPGSLTSIWNDRINPLDHTVSLMSEIRGLTSSPVAAQIFGNAGIEYCEKFGATPEHMAKIGEKNHRHSSKNPYSQFRDIYSLNDIKSSPIDNAVEIVAQSMATDSPLLLEAKSSIELAGADMTRRAAKDAFKKAGITPDDIQVVELHDCFSANELITYDALGLCKPGEAHKLIDNGDVTYGGKYVVNPSGGLISKGHPIGATGLAQCTELVWQLRGWCTNRQVPNLRYALQHNIGLGGAVVVTIYAKPHPSTFGEIIKQNMYDSRKILGYNPAVEARHITEKDFKK